MALPVQINPKHNKSTLERVCFYYEENFIRGLLRGCIGGASLNCINLVVPMNPCKCGYYPDRTRCSCPDAEAARYLGRISRPLLDRIDICMDVPALHYADLACGGKNEPSSVIRERIAAALERQTHRFRETGICCNSRIPSKDITKYCRLDGGQQKYMGEIYQKMDLSARGYYKILKTARTIADLEDSGKIRDCHLNEAICYRVQDKKYWE